MKNPNVFAISCGSQTLLRFQFGFYSFKAVQEIFPECEYQMPWRDFDGDQYLQVAIPSDVAAGYGISHRSTFSLLTA